METPLKPKDAPELARFDWEDPLRLEDRLDEDERMLRDAARAFALDRLQPRVTEAFRNETV
ncbi:acyl-CoA dehydrogenase, partial [Rhodovulum sulfidophilum]|nr:acyl-CoA dehydrogenase [Rhodovulum sulfidophilum]